MRLGRAPVGLSVFIAAGCSAGQGIAPGAPDATSDVAVDVDAASAFPDADAVDVAYVEPSSDASIANPCSLPGSVQFTSSGMVVVSGGSANPDLTFLHLPVGFCAHYYGMVGNARQLRFAPGGELFVASPTTGTTGAGPGGQSAIVVLPDDNHDGVADVPVCSTSGGPMCVKFLSNLPSTQALLFANHRFYYQDNTKIMSVPYTAGDRAPSAGATEVADITVYVSNTHWPKTLDVADDGTIYVGNGGDQGEACDSTRPFHGGILKLDGTPGGTPVARGFRNPISVRCARGKNTCFALELGMDYSWSQGGHEKLVPIRSGDDWGYPCCATQNVPFDNVAAAICANTTPDTNSFVIGDTPFGVDFDPGNWPAPWGGNAFVATHGVVGSWVGARIIAIVVDRNTALMMPSTDVTGSSMSYQDQGAMSDFATGWEDHAHGRPSAVTFSGDGRLFVANDQNGIIFWIAPMKL
jgi:glucose/arabinose dehydrogenase